MRRSLKCRNYWLKSIQGIVATIAALMAGYILLLFGCVTPAEANPTFSLAASPTSLTIVQGNSASVTITMTPSGGFTSSVELNVLGDPASSTFSPASVSPSSSASTLTISVDADVQAGTYPLTIQGSSEGITQTIPITLIVPSTLAAPSDLTAAAVSSSQINLSWTGVPNATGYNLDISQDGINWTDSFASISGETTYQVQDALSGTNYFFRVHSTATGYSPSPPSNEANAITPSSAITLSVAPGNASVSLTWTPYQSTTAYDVQRSTSSSGPFTTIAPAFTGTSYTDNGVTNGTQYYYQVAVTNSDPITSNQVESVPTSGYVVEELEDIYGDMSPFSQINDAGQALFEGAEWQNGVFATLIPSSFEPIGINGYGTLLGIDGNLTTAAIFQAGQEIPLTGLTWTPRAINNSNKVVGYQTDQNMTVIAPMIWVNGTSTQLPADNVQSPCAEALGINNNGVVIGISSDTNYIQLPHAVYWDASQNLHDLSTLGGAVGYAYSINDSNQIVGASTLSGESTFHAALWQDGGVQDLGTLSGDTQSDAYGINNNGQVVGESIDYDADEHAFIWDGVNGMRNLNAFLPANSGWVLQVAVSINDQGEIIGSGTYNGQYGVAFILTPPTNSEHPEWQVQPDCHCHPQGGPTGPNAGEPVNPVTGEEDYTPDADLTVYNPNGPAASFQRTYSSAQAALGYSSPGMSTGWTHNYDYVIQPSGSGPSNTLSLVYPNGAQETIDPVIGSSGPTGAFNVPPGTPYYVQGTWDSSTAQWSNLTLTWKDRSSWHFDLNNGVYTLNKITNATGQSINLSWESGRYLQTVTDATSGTALLTLSYNGTQISSITDAYGREVAYSYGTTSGVSSPVLTSVSQIAQSGTINPPAHWGFTYSAYNSEPMLATITVPSPTGNGTSSFNINYSGDEVTSTTDANGNSQQFYYGQGYTGTQVSGPSGPAILSVTNFYQPNGYETASLDAFGYYDEMLYGDVSNPSQPTQIYDKNGNLTQLFYDNFGNVVQSISPRGVVTQANMNYTNFALGEVASVQEGAKVPISFVYNEPSGLVQSITYPEPGVVGSGSTEQSSFTYDNLGNLLTATTPGNNATGSITTTYNYTSDSTYSYSQNDAVGQPIAIQDNLGNTTHLRYNSQGLPITEIDPTGIETDFGAYPGDQTGGYNIADQPLRITYPATGESGNGRSYDLNSYLYPGGALLNSTSYDESGNQVLEDLYGYGLEGELTSVTGSNAPIFYTYDGDYRIADIADGDGNKTGYSYDAAGNLYQIVYPGATSTTPGSSDTVTYSSYDGDGNPLVRIDGNNVQTDYTYNDPESLLTDIHYPGGQLADTSYEYDDYGRRYEMADPTGTVNYSYDDLDNLTQVTTNYTGIDSRAITYAYYPDGSRQTMGTFVGNYSYDYDGAGRLLSLTNPESQTTAWGYRNNDWVASQTLSTGEVTSYTYDALGNVTDLANKSSTGAVLSEYSAMSYDGAGDLTTMTANIPSETQYNGTTTYDYDSITGIGTRHQLMEEESTRDGGYSEAFSYDGGSYGASSGVGNPTTMRGDSFSFNADNEITDSGYAYDGNGNPTTYAANTLTFDPENRLTSVGTTLTAGYNGDGLRAWRQDSNGKLWYLYDGDQPIIELSSDSGAAWVNTFGPDGGISTHTAGADRYFTWDPQGNVATQLNASGNASSPNMFDAFGLRDTGTPWPGQFSYAGQWGAYTDTSTGLILMGHRYYDPGTGRFLTRDPIGYAGGSNLYAYTGNNPVNEVDPDGTVVAPVAGMSLLGSGSALLEATGAGALAVGAAWAGWEIGSPAGNALAGTIIPQQGLASLQSQFNIKSPVHIAKGHGEAWGIKVPKNSNPNPNDPKIKALIYRMSLFAAAMQQAIANGRCNAVQIPYTYFGAAQRMLINATTGRMVILEGDTITNGWVFQDLDSVEDFFNYSGRVPSIPVDQIRQLLSKAGMH